MRPLNLVCPEKTDAQTDQFGGKKRGREGNYNSASVAVRS